MKCKKGFKYQLVENEMFFHTSICPLTPIKTHFISLTVDGCLTIYRDYAWDGPSGPTVDTADVMTPSLAHDAFYQLIRMGLLDEKWREVADEYMGKLMEARRSKKKFLRMLQSIRAWFWVRELKKFAASAAAPENKKEILEFP
jgi:hypothetical protein